MGQENTAPRKINGAEGTLGQIMQSQGPGVVETWEPNPSSATLVVAASDSLHPERADYQCDGTADDVEIQAAITALPAGGGKVVLLEGLFTVSGDGTKCLFVPSNVHIQGQGGATTVKLAANQDCAIFMNTGIAGAGNSNITISDMKIDGTKATQATGLGIHFGYVSNCLFQNLNIINCKQTGIFITRKSGSGLYTDQSTDCILKNLIVDSCDWDGIGVTSDRILVDNCISSNNGRSGCSIEESRHCSVNGGFFFLNTETGLDLATENIGIILDGASCHNNTQNGIAGACDDWVISGCKSYDNTQKGIYILYSERVAISGCDIYSNGHQGISAPDSDPDNGDITITGCEIYANTLEGILIHAQTLGSSVISGNKIKGNGDSGIHLYQGSSLSSISGNVISGNGQYGIYIHGLVHSLSITGNTISDNSQDAANTYDGIYLLATGGGAVEHGTIVGNVINGGDHRWGIFQPGGGASGGSESYVIKSNRISGATTGMVSLNGDAGKNSVDLTLLSASLDLSGGAVDLDIFHATCNCYLVGYYVFYTELSSADAGVDIRIGRYQDGVALDDDHFDLVTSEVSQNLGYQKRYISTDLTNQAIVNGDTVTVGTAGAKVGTGEISVVLLIVENAG